MQRSFLKNRLFACLAFAALLLAILVLSVWGGYQFGEQHGYSRGYQFGEQHGYSRGYQNGYAHGKEEGYKTGKRDGYAQGYTDGHIQGMNDGYANGYNDGQQTALQQVLDWQENACGADLYGYYQMKFWKDSSGSIHYTCVI